MLKAQMEVTTAVATVLLLAGCSGGPSPSDVERVLQEAARELGQEMAQLGTPQGE